MREHTAHTTAGRSLTVNGQLPCSEHFTQLLHRVCETSLLAGLRVMTRPYPLRKEYNVYFDNKF